MTPADGLDLVVNELVDQKPLAIMQFRYHRGPLDDDGLHDEYAEKYENDDDEEDIAGQTEPFGPKPLSRFATEPRNDDVGIVILGNKAEAEFFLLSEIEHISDSSMYLREHAVGSQSANIKLTGAEFFVKAFIYQDLRFKVPAPRHHYTKAARFSIVTA